MSPPGGYRWRRGRMHRTPARWLWYRWQVAAAWWRTWRLHHPLRKSALQRGYESGDPARVARVRACSREVLRQLGEDDRGPG